MVHEPTDWQQPKQAIRARAQAARRKQADKDGLSREICGRLAVLPEYAGASVVMFYVDVGSEVRTRPFLPMVWEHGKRVVVPYCVGNELELFGLEGLDELAPGAMRIPEPRPDLRDWADRHVSPSELDLIVVPGLAFDRCGGRLGRGRGYYDRLLCQVPPKAALIGLAFECQLVDEVPMLPHDVRLHRVVTERGVYDGPTR